VLIEDSLSPENVVMAETAKNSAEIIHQLADRIAARLGLDCNPIEEAVLTRERARTTAFTNGAAIPHCRLAELTRFGMAMMILRKPIRWDNQGHAVDIILMIAGPSRNIPEQLRILANSSQVLDSAALRAKLKQAPNPEGVCQLLSAAEQAVERRRAEEGVLRELRRDQADAADYLVDVVNKFLW
jgi:PTS system nitrogen regulatory IIA component